MSGILVGTELAMDRCSLIWVQPDVQARLGYVVWSGLCVCTATILLSISRFLWYRADSSGWFVYLNILSFYFFSGLEFYLYVLVFWLLYWLLFSGCYSIPWFISGSVPLLSYSLLWRDPDLRNGQMILCGISAGFELLAWTCMSFLKMFASFQFLKWVFIFISDGFYFASSYGFYCNPD